MTAIRERFRRELKGKRFRINIDNVRTRLRARFLTRSTQAGGLPVLCFVHRQGLDQRCAAHRAGEWKRAFRSFSFDHVANTRLAPRTDSDLNDEIENAMAGRFPQGLVAAPKEKRKVGADPRSAASLRTHARIFLANAHAQRISRFFAAGLVPRDDVLGGRYSRESAKMHCATRGFGVFL